MPLSLGAKSCTPLVIDGIVPIHQIKEEVITMSEVANKPAETDGEVENAVGELSTRFENFHR